MASIASSVRESGAAEVAQVSTTLADALANDPIFQWLFPSQRRRDSRLRRLFATELVHYVFPAGQVLTIDDFRGANVERPTLDRCDQEGVPAYLEASTERSAALYERLGFVHLGELRIPDGGPPFWPMRRPPNAA